MSAASYSWSLGTVVGVPFAVLGVIALVGCAWLCWRWFLVELDDEYGMASMAAVIGGLTVIGIFGAIFGIVWGEYPYNSEYHQWRTTAGTVTAVDSRLLADGHGSTQRFVVTLSGFGQRSCDDTRCAEVKVGDQLTLSCKRVWMYAASDPYDCNFVADERGAK